MEHKPQLHYKALFFHTYLIRRPCKQVAMEETVLQSSQNLDFKLVKFAVSFRLTACFTKCLEGMQMGFLGYGLNIQK